MKKLSTLILLSVMLVAAWSCSDIGNEIEYFDKPTDVVNPNPPLPPVDFTKTSLGDLAEMQGIKLGVAVTHSEYFQNDSVPKILKREFKSVTFGNEMKHDAIVGSNGKLKFDTADEMVNWAKECEVDLFGHTLGWHSQQQTAYLNSLIDKAAADNSASILADNWNFETGAVSPFTADGFDITDSYSDVFAGAYSAKASKTDATLTIPAAIAAGTPYIISFWAKGPEDGKVSLVSGDGQNAATAVSTEWYKYSVTLPTKSVGEFAYKITASENVTIDNIRIIETEIEEEDNKGGNYINPYAVDGGLDFESFTAGTNADGLIASGKIAQINGGASVSVSDEYANSGSLSLKMDNADGHAGNAWDIQVITAPFDITPGKTYRVAWYARSAEEADLQIDLRLASGTQYKNSAWGQYPKMGTNWTYQYLDVTAADGDTEIQIAFYGGTAAACYYIDDIQVFEAIYEGDYTNYIEKTNLLEGADFENSSAWGIWNGSDNASIISRNDPEIDANKDNVHSALHALKVDNIGTGWTGGSAWHIQVANNNKITVTPGASYRTGMWVKSPDGATTIQVEQRYDNGSTGYKQISGITDKWTYIYRDDVMPEDATEVQIVLDCAYEEATYYIDDVQFYPTPVETCIDPSSVADDGDFEAYADVAALQAAGWQVNGASQVSIVSDAHHGSNAVRMDNSTGFATNAWDIQLVSKKYPIESGKTYRIAWQAKADAADVDMQIDIRLPGGTQYKSSAWGQYDKMGSDWTLQYLDVTTADGDDEIQVGFYGGGSQNIITIDCFQIYPVEASAAAQAAKRGYGKYPSWTRPAPMEARLRAAEFESTNKLDGELADDAIGYAYKTWVYAMIGHFDAYAWDVMNETFTENGNWRNVENTPDGFIWGTYFGDQKTFVDKAFAYATDALAKNNKTADLYINDYNLETSEAKRKAFCDYAKGNSKITGVGTQMHLDMATSDLESKITASLTDLVATGKKVRISELDIKCTDTEAQAAMYKYIFDQYIKIVPAAQRGGITIWGINDKDSWVGEANAPLLWTGNKYNKKPAYEALYVYLCELNNIYPYVEEEE